MSGERDNRPKPPLPYMDEDLDERTAEFSIKDLMGRQGPPSKGKAKVPALMAVAGRALGKVFRLEKNRIVLGRADDAEVSVHDDGVSRRHATIVFENSAHVITDLGSTNGTFVNKERITGPVTLREGDDISIGGTTMFRFAMRDELEEQLQERLYDLATRDPLTKTYNRRHFDERMISEWAWAMRHGQPCAICSLDADHFKRVNDTHGHAAGDYVLSELSDVVRTIIRKEDIFARMGGEEFVVLARDTPFDAATGLAERLRAAIARHEFVFEGKRIPVTVSIGVATSTDASVKSAADLLARADAGLYRAKHEGRDRVGVVL